MIPPLPEPPSEDSVPPAIDPGAVLGARLASRLRRLGLAGIASAILEAGAPLAPLIGQLLYVAQPTLGLFLPRRAIGDWAKWLDQPGNLTALIEDLDQPAPQPDDHPTHSRFV